MSQGFTIGFGVQPYTLLAAPGAFNLLGYDAKLPTNGATQGLGMTGSPGSFLVTGATAQELVGGTFPTATPTFSPAAGNYENALRVTISCSTPGTQYIFYTTNGSTPTTSSTVYAGTINVPAGCTVKAIAIVGGYGQSAVGSATYNIALNQPAGAVALNYNNQVYNIAPLVTDIAIGDGVTASDYPATYKFSNGYAYNFGKGSGFWTNPALVALAQGVLQLISPSSGQPAGIFGEMPQGLGTAGALGFIVAANGFYVECHYALSAVVPANDTNPATWDFFGCYPKEKDAAKISWLELDIQEGGLGGPSGLQQTVISWSGGGSPQNKDEFNDYSLSGTVDRTQFHRYGLSYDPIGKAITFYIDDTARFSVSTLTKDSNTQVAIDASINGYHYYPTAIPQTNHSPQLAYSMYVSNLQLWTPAPAGAGATQVFGYVDFSTSPSAIFLRDSEYSGAVIRLINPPGGHAVGTAFYTTKQPPSAFTTTFSFQNVGLTGLPTTHAGFGFCIQNTASPPGNANYVGVNYAGDANMCGYGGAITQTPPVDSVFIKFDAGCGTSGGQVDYLPGSQPSSTGMYFNGGPGCKSGGSLALNPMCDMNPYGINLWSGHSFNVTITYDGSILVMTILDTTTNAQARYEWPLALANTTNASGNYVGFLCGTNSASGGYYELLNWHYYSGYNARLATPTFSPTPGQYSGTQTVTINYPAGSTCYYTTNGLNPTSSSTPYTGPIAVSANAVIKAVAISAGSTDSYVGNGVYQIGTANVINFPSGFSAGNLVSVGLAYLSGSAYRVTDTTGNSSGACWFPAQVNIQTFSTSFTIQLGGQGCAFVIQNDPAPYNSSGYDAGSVNNAVPATSPNAVNWSGGFTVIGQGNNSIGYGGLNYQPGTTYPANAFGLLNSIGLAFCTFGVGGDANNNVGLYTNGQNPFGSGIATGLSFQGNTFNVTITYNGTTLSLSMQATTGGTTFTHSWTINIPSTIGWNTAYVGFTGGTGGAAAVQAISAWTFAQG